MRRLADLIIPPVFGWVGGLICVLSLVAQFGFGRSVWPLGLLGCLLMALAFDPARWLAALAERDRAARDGSGPS